ncbi:nucleotidyltransferase domain-containing protein [Bradyrhizobium sp.]|uniref:nucleotidyltransferase domain-containing protein n=1 Tax=Bradyrhizobium sp. TaxID=376 RepID=UPI001ED4F87C|nr:nucleotidyltransferase domain-containing protein [Bradyrhizobium sp.]MBV8918902.1 nucleotidyltransferase domain-containing protein [Bradyrhizobium sp.]MBV9979618.1 nucleotidyltransferase domain-containing protein [Bradyrhizobium sp.]
MQGDDLLQRVVTALGDVESIAAIVLGGSRARGMAHATSDYDIGLHFSSARPLDTDRLLLAVKTFVDDPDAASVTAVGAWGPWIVGGAWLSVWGCKVDLLYRNVEAVGDVIEACRAGEISMHYQPGHPHGFCSASWMGEIALCKVLHDPCGIIAALKAKTVPYPAQLGDALIRRFEWEILFAIENGELAIPRDEQTHVAGSVYRALACLAQVLFALNGRYLVNEKGALAEAATFPRTIPNLMGRTTQIWRFIGAGDFRRAFAMLRTMERELQVLITSAGQG